MAYATSVGQSKSILVGLNTDNTVDSFYSLGRSAMNVAAQSVASQFAAANEFSGGLSASGNTLTLTLAITFSAPFTGDRIIYSAAGNRTQNSGWQAIGIRL